MPFTRRSRQPNAAVGFCPNMQAAIATPIPKSLVAAIARIEAAVRGDAVSQSGAVSGNDLAEIAAEIERIGAAIGAERTRAPDIAAAAERILDITLSCANARSRRRFATRLMPPCAKYPMLVRPAKQMATAFARSGANAARPRARVDGLITLSRGGECERDAGGSARFPIKTPMRPRRSPTRMPPQRHRLRPCL